MLAEAETFDPVRHLRKARRIRLDVVQVRHNPWFAQSLQQRLSAVQGIRRAVANHRSGRVLIEYAADAPFLDQLNELFSQRPRPPENNKRPAPHRVPRGPMHRAPVVPGAARAHALTVEEVVTAVGTHARNGISEREARQRLARFHENVLQENEARSRTKILLGQMNNLPTTMLIGSAVLSLLLGDFTEAIAIGTVVGLNSAIGYRIEKKSEDLLASWARFEAGQVQVLRGGRLMSIPASDLVPGDLWVFRAGDIVPADVRVSEAHRAASDQAPLTGESEPVPKDIPPVAEITPLAERSSMLYRGTTVVSGHGRAVVVATGNATELAQVQELVRLARPPRAVLEERLDEIARRVTWASLGAAAVSSVAGLLYRRPGLEILRGAVALGVAAIPEGMPVASTAGLVRSMAYMRKAGIVVRRVGAAATLGSVTVVCTDKTGTLTLNEMRVELLDFTGAGDQLLKPDAVRCNSGDPLANPGSRLLAASVLNSELDYHHTPQGELEIAGSSTERALALLANQAGLNPKQLRMRFPRLSLAERHDGVHYVVSIHRTAEGGRVAFIKGAPEQVVPLCRNAEDRALAEPDRNRILRRNLSLATQGLRVLAVGWQRIEEGQEPIEAGWTYLGMIALRDPIRPHAADAIHRASRAGIRTVILTGDQRATAAAIAKEVGLEGEALDGTELIKDLHSGDAAALKRLDRVAVLSRVTPAEKVYVVEALRKRGHVVAMAGDGINDAPAIKSANVGIAVGAGSSDMARQTADVVLEHEDLRAILAAVGQGRIVQDNLRRAARYLFATNLSEVVVVVGASLFGRTALNSRQLLWLNLLTDTLPALALVLEQGDPNILNRRPVPPDQPLLEGRDWRGVVKDGLLLAAMSGAAFVAGGPPAGFGALGAAQFAYAVQVQSPNGGSSRNFATWVGGSAALQACAVFLSPLRRLLLTAPPSPAAIASFAIASVLPWCLGLGPGDELVQRGGHYPQKQKAARHGDGETMAEQTQTRGA
jgi:P-type Ca2+ transporter type 2C